MAVVDTDIKLRLSVKTGSAGDSTASSVAASLGKYMSTTAITDATKANLLANITQAESTAGVVKYKCLFVLNDHASQTAEGMRVHISAQDAGGGVVAIGLDPAGATARNSGSAQAAEIADEETAPTGVTFSAPSTYDDGIVVGDVAFDECAAVWVRLTVDANIAAMDEDQALLEFTWATDA